MQTDVLGVAHRFEVGPHAEVGHHAHVRVLAKVVGGQQLQASLPDLLVGVCRRHVKAFHRAAKAGEVVVEAEDGQLPVLLAQVSAQPLEHVGPPERTLGARVNHALVERHDAPVQPGVGRVLR